jgi:hypothetical protein
MQFSFKCAKKERNDWVQWLRFQTSNTPTLYTHIAFVVVTPKQRLEGIYGHFLIAECQTGKRSALCTTVSDRLVLSNKGSVKDHNNALPKWRMTYWKWYSALLLLASEELPVDLVLPKEQSGGPCMTSACVPFTSETSKLCSQMITLHG